MATEGGVMMRKRWRKRVGGGGLEEEAREKAHAGGLRVWDVGEGDVRMGWWGGVGRSTVRKQKELHGTLMRTVATLI